MERVAVYQFAESSFEVIPQEHVVNDSSRVKKSALPEALRNLGVTVVIAVVAGVILYFIGDAVDRALEESGIKKVILAGIVGAMIGMLFMVGLKARAVFSSLFKPNLKTPEKAVRSFLSSLQKGLHERAYNHLTDTAQRLGKLEMPKEDMMQKKMPDLYFEDSDTFKSYWTSLKFPWKLPEYEQPKAEKINDSTAIVETRIDINRTVFRDDERAFIARFVTVKRDNLWFVANGFFWPQVE